MWNKARELLARLNPFEKQVAAAAAERLLREMDNPERDRQAAQERERTALINEGVPPKDAADLARGGGGRAPWLTRGTRRRRAKRQGDWW